MSEELSIEQLEAKHKALLARRDALQNDVNRVQAARDERKRSLKETMEECKKEGLNPDTLAADIQRLRSVVSTKIEVIAGDMTEAEAMVRPMLKELERG